MIKTNLEALGGRLKEARERLGIMQRDAASRVGVQPATWSQFESGVRRPSIEVLAAIAEALDVSADWLLGRESDLTPSGPRLKALQSAAEELDDRSLRSLIDIAKVLKKTQGKG